MRCPRCLREGVDKVLDERVGRACSLGIGAAGGYAGAATLAKAGAIWGGTLGSLGTPLGALLGAICGGLLGGLGTGTVGWLVGRALDRRLSEEFFCKACEHRFKR